jgi:hypothetical protein
MKVEKIKEIEVPFTSWDFHYINNLIVLFGHEAPAKIFNINNGVFEEVMDIGKIFEDKSCGFVNTSEVCDKYVLFGDYFSNGLFVSYDITNSKIRTFKHELESSLKKIVCSPNNQYAAIANNTNNGNIMLFNIEQQLIEAKFAGQLPCKWNDNENLLFKKSGAIIKRNILTGEESTIIEKIEGFSIDSIDVNKSGILFSTNQEHEYARNSYSYSVSKFNNFSRCFYLLFGTNYKIEIYNANCWTDNVKILNEKTFLLAHGWHGDNAENGNIYSINLDKDNNTKKTFIGTYDSGYGHEELYTPYSLLQLNDSYVFALRTRSGKLKIIELNNGVTNELNADLVYYTDKSDYWNNEIYSCKFQFIDGELMLIANQKRHITVLKIEI